VRAIFAAAVFGGAIALCAAALLRAIRIARLQRQLVRLLEGSRNELLVAVGPKIRDVADRWR